MNPKPAASKNNKSRAWAIECLVCVRECRPAGKVTLQAYTAQALPFLAACHVRAGMGVEQQQRVVLFSALLFPVVEKGKHADKNSSRHPR